ncbi:MAG: selenium-dependent molybdenum cofactor biosynthesis protein YqeB [Clostridia bacterium]
MLIHIKGAGDIASGVAVRLKNVGFKIVMTELEKPTAIRREVSFASAVYRKEIIIEGIKAVSAKTNEECADILKSGNIAVFSGDNITKIKYLNPKVIVDAILAKKNTGTTIYGAEIVIALGPGFIAGKDCDAVIETMRGHNLGRAIYSGSALDNTGEPGNIGGFTRERVLYSPSPGIFKAEHSIGDIVKSGDIIAYVGNEPVFAKISGVLRGILEDGLSVPAEMKIGDIDPRGFIENCFTVSDKARSIGGGVLEAILSLIKPDIIQNLS